MFRFENSDYLYLLILLIPVILWAFYTEKNRIKKRNKFIDKMLFHKIVPDFNKNTHRLRSILMILVFLFSILALANPQWANKREKVKVKSSDIFIALDISRSMLGQDISPNRLEKSKKVIEKLINRLKGNRIGLIFFAGEAFMKMPLSSDYAAAELFAKTANPDLIENQGTAIEEAIDIAEKGFDEKEKHQRAMVIFSDGEDHDGNAIAKAKEAHKNGLVIFTVGVGTTKGAFIPYKNRFGIEQYKKDKNGNYIKSKINEDLLNEIADAGGGKYYSISNGDNIIDNITQQLEKIEKREVEQRSFKSYDSYFQYFLIIAIILLVISFFIVETKNKLKTNKKMVNKAGMIVLIFFSLNANAQSGHKLRMEADKEYVKQDYSSAEVKYKKSLEKEENYKGNYNLGNALYKQNRYEEAAESYEDALKETTDSLTKSKIFHNLGNSYFQLKKFDKSLENYKQALRYNPYDQDTRKNLAFLKQILKQQQQQKKQQQQNKNQDNNKDKNKEKNQEKNKQENKDKQQQNKENQEEKKDSTQQQMNQDSIQQQEQQMNRDSMNIPDSLRLSKQELLKLLKAIENDDKEIQKRIRKGGKSKRKEKDW